MASIFQIFVLDQRLVFGFIGLDRPEKYGVKDARLAIVV